MARIKICGVRDIETMHACTSLGVDWVGFVFYSASPRFIVAEHAASLSQSVPVATSGGPERVGLFVKPSDAEIADTLRYVDLDVLQIYDSPQRAEALQTVFAPKIWLARGVATPEDLPGPSALDGFVVEAKSMAQDSRPGGLGRCMDWSLTAHWKPSTPWLLAGGLTPDNVAEAITISGADAVDVSSGVESQIGQKSSTLIKKFVANARK